MQKSKSKNTKERHIAANIAFGALWSIIIAMALLMIFAAFTSSGAIPENMMSAVVVVSCFISTIIGSRLAIKRAAENKLLVGAAQGVFTFIVIFAIGRAASADAVLGSITLAILAASLLGGTLGGYSGKRRKRTVKR